MAYTLEIEDIKKLLTKLSSRLVKDTEAVVTVEDEQKTELEAAFRASISKILGYNDQEVEQEISEEEKPKGKARAPPKKPAPKGKASTKKVPAKSAKKAPAGKKAPAKKTATKKTKAKKDPNAPKRGKSAFIFYSMERRAALKEEQPELSFGEVGKALGAEWKELSAKEKKPYETLAAKDKKRAEKEKAAYESKGSAEESNEEGSGDADAEGSGENASDEE